MKRLFVLTVVALVSAPLFAQSRSAAAPSLQGVWRIVEVTTTGPGASKNTAPQPSLYIFTARHYSLIRVNGTTTRADLPEDQTKATAAQLLAAYGNAVTAQSGTYEVAGGKLTLRPLVAKNPATMKGGVFNTSSYKLDGSTLTFVSESSNTGPVASPTTFKLMRVE